ncbi:MAG: type II secretion system F family protein, partial [Lachnospiraceae bacterium]|nr:type II secretion system F family protein [Lachnospiraceae bacterium]
MQKLNYDDISGICSGMAMLLHAGTGTADALALVAEDMEGTKIQPVLKHMAEEADNGMTLTQVFENEGCFPPHLTALLAVGERTGHTEESFRSLSGYYESRSRMSRQIRDALIYPMILLIIMLVVIAVLLVYVLPIFNSVYQQLGGRLTGIAGGLYRLGQVISKLMPVLCVLLAALTAFIIAFAVSDSFRDKVISLWRARFGDKGLAWQASSAHFARAFSMGISSGMELEEALELSAGLLEGVPGAKEKCDSCRDMLMKGSPLSDALKTPGL